MLSFKPTFSLSTFTFINGIILINNYLKCEWVECPNQKTKTQKQDPYICCLQETHLKTGDTYRLKVKGWKKIFHTSRNQNKAGVVILISDKIDFKTKVVKRDKEGQYVMIKGSIQEEDITIMNIYVPNIGAPQYVRQMLTSMKGEINNNTIIAGDFNTPLTPMDRSTKQKINKETKL